MYVTLPKEHCWNCRYKSFRYGALYCEKKQQRTTGTACEYWLHKELEPADEKKN